MPGVLQVLQIDQPFIRTVLILRHRTRTRIAELRASHQNASSISQPPNLETSVEETLEPIADDNSGNSQSCPVHSVAGDISYLRIRPSIRI